MEFLDLKWQVLGQFYWFLGNQVCVINIGRSCTVGSYQVEVAGRSVVQESFLSNMQEMSLLT